VEKPDVYNPVSINFVLNSRGSDSLPLFGKEGAGEIF
jgi:hypothetical protein